MASVFTKIINREIPADIFYEDENFIAILDINPIRDGHILVIPKKETDYIFDLSDDDYIELMLTVKKISSLLSKKISNKIEFSKIAIVVEGFDVPHVHVHLIPLLHSDTLTPESKTKLSLNEVKNILFN